MSNATPSTSRAVGPLQRQPKPRPCFEERFAIMDQLALAMFSGNGNTTSSSALEAGSDQDDDDCTIM